MPYQFSFLFLLLLLFIWVTSQENLLLGRCTPWRLSAIWRLSSAHQPSLIKNSYGVHEGLKSPWLFKSDSDLQIVLRNGCIHTPWKMENGFSEHSSTSPNPSYLFWPTLTVLSLLFARQLLQYFNNNIPKFQKRTSEWEYLQDNCYYFPS